MCALLAVNLLNLGSDIAAYALAAELIVVDAADAEHLMGIQRTGGQRLAAFDAVAAVHLDAGVVRNHVDLGLALFLVDDGLRVHDALLRLFDGHGARNLGQHGHLLRFARFEEFFDTGQTLCDVVTGNAAGMEGTHRQLCARFTD